MVFIPLLKLCRTSSTLTCGRITYLKQIKRRNKIQLGSSSSHCVKVSICLTCHRAHWTTLWIASSTIRVWFNRWELIVIVLCFAARHQHSSSPPRQYWKMTVRDKNGDTLERSCDRNCERKLLCNIVTADNNDVTLCKRIRDSARNRNFYFLG